MYSNRTEQVDIKLTLSSQQAVARHALALKLLLGRQYDACTPIAPGDRLAVSYTLFLDYFDDTAIKLEAINSILADPYVVTDANCAALEEGRLLFYETLKRLDKVIRKIKKRRKAALKVLED